MTSNFFNIQGKKKDQRREITLDFMSSFCISSPSLRKTKQWEATTNMWPSPNHFLNNNDDNLVITRDPTDTPIVGTISLKNVFRLTCYYYHPQDHSILTFTTSTWAQSHPLFSLFNLLIIVKLTSQPFSTGY